MSERVQLFVQGLGNTSAQTALTQLTIWWLYFFFYSVAGWMVESLYCSIGERRIINRGFLNGPYCPIYGAGGIIAALLGLFVNGVSLQAVFFVFVFSGTTSCALEYVTSVVMEKLYHARWWDYSTRTFNIEGRVWLGGFLQFASCCCVVVFIIHPALSAWLAQFTPELRVLCACLSFIVMSIDLVITHIGLATFKQKMDSVQQNMHQAVHEHLDAVREALPNATELRESLPSAAEMRDALPSAAELRETLSHASSLRKSLLDPTELKEALPRLSDLRSNLYRALAALLPDDFEKRLTAQERRILDAFPSMRPSGYREFLDDLKARLRNNIKEWDSRK